MRLVVDANVFIAAFLKDALTRELLLNEQLDLTTPEYGLIETRKVLKRPKILKRLGLSSEIFDWLWTVLTESVEVIPQSEYESEMGAAQQLIADQKDVPYLACALKLDAAIWSNDPDFQIPRAKSRVTVLTTIELIRRLSS